MVYIFLKYIWQKDGKFFLWLYISSFVFRGVFFFHQSTVCKYFSFISFFFQFFYQLPWKLKTNIKMSIFIEKSQTFNIFNNHCRPNCTNWGLTSPKINSKMSMWTKNAPTWHEVSGFEVLFILALVMVLCSCPLLAIYIFTISSKLLIIPEITFCIYLWIPQIL